MLRSTLASRVLRGGGGGAGKKKMMATATKAALRSSSFVFPAMRPMSAVRYFGAWSKELEPHPDIKPASDIIRVAEIEHVMEATKSAAQDSVRVKEILQRAVDKALLQTPHGTTEVIPSADPQHEFVQGLNLEEAATLLNLDPVTQPDLLQELYNTALTIKERIYGNRIVLFAPLYLSNYCVNTCTYCAFRGKNKTIPRTLLTQEQLIQEVQTLQQQGHPRLLLLTGEHPKVRERKA
jgi:hypothetical protein